MHKLRQVPAQRTDHCIRNGFIRPVCHNPLFFVYSNLPDPDRIARPACIVAIVGGTLQGRYCFRKRTAQLSHPNLKDSLEFDQKGTT